jgi:hypothetical protein
MKKSRFMLCYFFVGLITSFQVVAVPPGGAAEELINQLTYLETKVDTLQTSIRNLDSKIDNLPAAMVPFRTTIAGGLCDSSVNGNLGITSNPELIIDGDLSGASFVVNSILIQTESFTEEGRVFTVNNVTVDGLTFETSTNRIFDTYTSANPPSGQTAPGFDIMGLRLVEVNGIGDEHQGGVFPTQIAATSNGNPDIKVRFFCRSDLTDWNISSISVSGMKYEDDVISVAYTPGD